MPKPGRDLEKLVESLEHHLSGYQNIAIRSPDRIRGQISQVMREVDVTLRARVGSSEMLVVTRVS
jgi:hypothetical protein